jgi:phage-related protein
LIVRELVTLLGFELKDGPLKKYDKEIDSTKAKSNGLSTAAKGIGTAYKVAAAAVAIGIGWISKNILDATVEMEGYRSQIQAFTGDADSAAAVLSELRDKTVDPLFGTGNLVNAYKGLRTVGMGADDASRMIDVLGDVANGSAENFNALGGVLTRVASTGKVNEGTLRQLANAGFGVQDMAQGLGMSVGQLNAQIDAGKIGFNDLTRAMEGATKEGGRFYQNAERQARTLSGSIKILQDTIGSMGDAIGTAVLPSIVDLIRYITDLIKIGKTGLVDFGMKAFDYLIHVMAQVIIFFEVLQMRMEKYGGAFTALKNIFRDVFDFFRSVILSAWPLLMNLAQLILVAFKPLEAFVKPILESLKPIIKNVFGFFSRLIGGLIPLVNGLTPLFGTLGRIIGGLLGPIAGVALAIRGVNTAIAIGKGVVSGIKAIQTSYQVLAGTMSVMKAAAEGNRLALLMLDAQMIKSRIVTLAKAAADKIAAVATKVWSGIQAVFNAIMAANPIALIIIGVIALIAAVVLLVKNWDKVGPAIMNALSAIGNFFKMIGSAIAGFFKMIWNAVVSFFNKIIGFVKKNLVNIVNIVIIILFPIAGIVMALVRLIIKHWDKIKAALVKIFTFVVEKLKAIWGKIVEIVQGIIEKVKNIWLGIMSFFRDLLDTVKMIWQGIWNKVVEFVTGIIERIKNVWEGIKEFFSNLFGFIGDVAAGVWNRIKDTFIAVFEGIKERFLGFIDAIKEGWEKVKGFFSGIGEGVVNFFTGGGSEETVSGAGATSGGSLAGSAVQSAAASNTYNNGGNSQTINANSNINVNVPPGTSAEQARVISQQVDRAVQDSLSSAITGARGTIPSPEARRH